MNIAVSASIYSYTLQNVSCASCVRKIEARLSELPGVLSVSFNLALSRLTVEVSEDSFQEEVLFKALSSLHYPVVPPQDSVSRALHKEGYDGLWLVVLGLLLAMPMVLAMVLSLLGFTLSIPALAQFLLATPVQFWLGLRFYRGAFSSLRQGSANMDVLVALGTSAAYGYSLFLWWVQGASHLYFEASTVVIALVMLGKYLEHRAKNMTSHAIRQLMNLQPKIVKLWRDESLVDVPVETIIAGDEVQILPGESISVDGVIIDGASDIDEAMLTGESVPVHRVSGESVLAGTQNIDGSLRVRAAKSAYEFRIKHIADLVEHAQMKKPQVQQLVDNIAAVFVPAVVVIALLTLITQASIQGVETGLTAAIAVLIIACPCSLGLATPTAIIAASGVGAKQGLLIKDVDQLAAIAKAEHCIFDKTGTITEGKLSVVNQQIWGESPEAVCAAVRGVEALSHHPLASAIVTSLSKYDGKPRIQGFKNHSGKGVTAVVDNCEYAIGNEKLMQMVGLDVALCQVRLIVSDATVIWVAKKIHSQFVVVGVFELTDQIKKEAPTLFQWLHRSSINTWLLSGDNQASADAVVRELAIGQGYGDLLPDDKLDRVEEIKNHQGTTIMVGDGINDAPALAAADASIAMGNGTDIAMETAGITLMRPDIVLIAHAIELARKTQRKIRQNLFWAFFYNAMGIPLAAMGLLSPMLAGAAMAFSSVSVVVSSMLLLYWQPQLIKKYEN